MHQILLQGIVREEVVLVNLILFLVAFAHLLLRHDLLQEIDEADTHVWVSDSSVQDDRDGTSQLGLQVLVHTVVRFSVDLHEQLW